MPDRVARTAVLVGLAPSNAAGLNWFDGMTDGNVREYATANVDQDLLAERLRLKAERAIRDPESLLDLIGSQMAEPDRRVVENVAFRRLLTQSFAEALRGGPYGWIDDVLAFREEWGFPLDTVAGQVLLWHGKDDTFSPINHTWWLAEQIPNAEVQVQTATAHFGAVEILPRILSWLAA
jgi:pimeloyl-ACP methyl ester carboxylesterase